MKIFDTDIIIWTQKGNLKANKIIENTSTRAISIQTYMELLQCPQNKHQQKIIKDFLNLFDFEVLPLTENIGHRASIYIEEYSLKSGLHSADAIIAATATENNLPLISSNKKHFKPIPDLELEVFHP
jgi:predicted nucleic acid-binding protein